MTLQPPFKADRAELVAAAGESIRLGSRSFHAASRLFDRRTRERARLLYSWCRYCDDVCDSQVLGRPGGDRRGALDLDAMTRRTLRGEPVEEPAFRALGQLLRECPIPAALLFDHLHGFALDAEGWRPRSESDLVRYCYHVAGAVGRMMALVMGVPAEDERTLGCASDLGIAFQLSNIARDIAEDHAAGRCYLPADWLDEFGLDPADPLRAADRGRLVLLVRRLGDLAARYEASARPGIARLPFRSRWAILAAAEIYGRIGRRVVELGPRAWDGRVVVRRREKLLIIAASLRGALMAESPRPRVECR